MNSSAILASLESFEAQDTIEMVLDDIERSVGVVGALESLKTHIQNGNDIRPTFARNATALVGDLSVAGIDVDPREVVGSLENFTEESLENFVGKIVNKIIEFVKKIFELISKVFKMIFGSSNRRKKEIENIISDIEKNVSDIKIKEHYTFDIKPFISFLMYTNDGINLKLPKDFFEINDVMSKEVSAANRIVDFMKLYCESFIALLEPVYRGVVNQENNQDLVYRYFQTLSDLNVDFENQRIFTIEHNGDKKYPAYAEGVFGGYVLSEKQNDINIGGLELKNWNPKGVSDDKKRHLHIKEMTFIRSDSLKNGDAAQKMKIDTAVFKISAATFDSLTNISIATMGITHKKMINTVDRAQIASNKIEKLFTDTRFYEKVYGEKSSSRDVVVAKPGDSNIRSEDVIMTLVSNLPKLLRSMNSTLTEFEVRRKMTLTKINALVEHIKKTIKKEVEKTTVTKTFKSTF